MRYGIISDIHGNYDALEAVLEGLSGEGIDSIICLGDVVGYGPEPAQCLQRVKSAADYIVAGNHDLAVADRLSIRNFNMLAREATLWTRDKLDEVERAYLAELPLVHHLDGLDIVHGTLCSPELFDYIQTTYDASLSMAEMEAPVCFIGHSHVPITFVQKEVITYTLDTEMTVQSDERAIVNVGSVGQPRDRDPRACCAIYDTETAEIRLRRFRYDIDAVNSKIREAGLPQGARGAPARRAIAAASRTAGDGERLPRPPVDTGMPLPVGVSPIDLLADPPVDRQRSSVAARNRRDPRDRCRPRSP